MREGVDYYKERGYMVFTEAYHLKRGKCCGCGCRHCPWRKKDKSACRPDAQDKGA
ncbi:MAG: hypothetical protein J0L99_00865 [Chitinophagales bacterium]|nr:hypothetical protein [Chitinophagales bacterium]